MVGLLAMTSSVSLVGIWAYMRSGDKRQALQERKTKQSWWFRPWKQKYMHKVPNPPESSNAFSPAVDALLVEPPCALSEPIDASKTRQDIDYGLHAATLAAVVTTTGQLLFPPLQVAGLPLLVYMGIPSAQKAYDSLRADGRPSWALSETVALVVCLAGGYYWVGSLGFWLYYGGQWLLATKSVNDEVRQPESWLPVMTHLWKDGAACEVATTTLHTGDQVIIQSGEMSPVDGVITEGTAWLRPHALSPAASNLRKGIGDRVAATDIVIVGRICVQMK